jgi:hypothetical protein
MHSKPIIAIYQSELDLVSRWVMDYPDLETGGDFFGFWTRHGDPVIQFVLGPAGNARRTGHSFYQDIDYLKRCGEVLNGRFGLEHIGAWHSHHRLGLSQPSAGDVTTMKNALRSQDLSRFLISICNITGPQSVSIGGFLFRRDARDDYEHCEWKVLKEESPIRQSLRSIGQAIFTSPQTGSSPEVLIDRATSHADASHASNEKAQFSESSYWRTSDGKQYLRNVYEKLRNNKDVENVEILQLDDARVALSFLHEGQGYEIRFPADFPNSAPEVVAKGDAGIVPTVVQKVFKPRHRERNIRRLITSLGVLDDGTILIIRRF